MSSLFITGASGFTGQHLARMAEERGIEVFALKADLLDRQALRDELYAINPLQIFHLAAISSVEHGNHEEFYKVNVVGTLNLLECLVEMKRSPRRVFLTSTANVYGDAGVKLIDENLYANPVNHYGASKLAMESLAKIYYDKLPIIIGRPFNYTGVGQGSNFLIPKIVKSFAQNAGPIELGNTDIVREFNDVRDICEIYLELMRTGSVGETYNICSGRALSLENVLSLISNISGFKLEIVQRTKYKRVNDIHTLVGSPEKVLDRIGGYNFRPITETLEWMYSAEASTFKSG